MSGPRRVVVVVHSIISSSSITKTTIQSKATLLVLLELELDLRLE